MKQENSYYGFGLVMPNSPVATPGTDNKQLYNGGSEWQKDYGNLPDYYQTFYRNYDAAIGRFVAVDPQAESAYTMNSYQYAGNNPIMMNDPAGNRFGPPIQANGLSEFDVQDILDKGEGRLSAYDAEGLMEGFPYPMGGGSTITGAGGGGVMNPNEELGGDLLTDEAHDAIANLVGGHDYTTTSGGIRWWEDNPSTISGNGEYADGKIISVTEATISSRVYFIPITEVTGNVTGTANQGGNDLNAAGKATDIVGGLYGAAGRLVLSGDQWLGKNGKYYSTDWGGNGYTGSRAGALEAAGFYKWAGRATIGATVVIGGLQVYGGYQQDGGHFGQHAQAAAAGATGGLFGGWGGAEGGAVIGGIIGGAFGGIGAIPGAAIGAFIGGYFGSQAGSAIGSGSVNYYYDHR